MILLRFVAPSFLLPVFGVAAFPMLDVGLAANPQNFDEWNNMRARMGRNKAAANGKLVVLTQNGYQATWAGFSWGSEIADEKRQEESHVDNKKREEFQRQAAEREKAFIKMAQEKGATVTITRVEKPGPAVLMMGYFLLVIAAVVVGYAMPSGLLRTILFCSLAGMGAACLLLQLLIGLPFSKTTPQAVTGLQHFIDGPPHPSPNGFVEEKSKSTIYVRHPFWCHLTWPILLGAMGFSGFELLLLALFQSQRSAGNDRGRGRPSQRRGDRKADENRPRGRRDLHAEESDEEDRPPMARGR